MGLRYGLIGALLLALAAAASASAAPAALRAGAASADITAPVGTPMFAYTARSYVFSPDPEATAERALQILADPDIGLYAKSFEPSVGIHTRLKARAIVLEQEGKKYALVQADLGGVPYALTQEVSARIAAIGIPAERLLLSATHTHSATGPIWPMDNLGYAFVGGDAFDPRVFEVTATGIAEAIFAANRRIEPARLGVGTTQLTGASRNREFEVHLRNSDVPDKTPVAARAGSIDPTVTVLRVDRTGGKGPIGVWSNFAVHPTSFGDGNLLFSGDNAGVAAQIVEETIEHSTGRKVVNVWTNGAQGDTSPDGDNRKVRGEDERWVPGDSAKAHLAGKRGAAGIIRAWRDAGKHMTRTPELGARRTLYLFDGSSHGATAETAEPVGPIPVLGVGIVAEGVCAPFDGFAGPGQGEKMPLLGGPGLAPTTMPVSLWRIQGQGIAAFPSEITKQMGERIRHALERSAGGELERVAIAGLTNAYLSYTATPEEYSACSYEGSFTLMGRQMGYAWLNVGTSLVAPLLRRAEAPPSAAELPSLGFGTTQSTPVRATPDAGAVVKQPATELKRFGRAVFSWRGGDPQADAQRGKPFVTLQREDVKGGWEDVATEASFTDTTERGSGDVWTETWQFDECAEPGRYRFDVSGRAVRALAETAAGYSVKSRAFEVGRVALAVGPVTVSPGGVATVRPLYPDPGKEAIVSLPRLVRKAKVTLTLSTGRTVRATDRDGDGAYNARVRGASVKAVRVVDKCGNEGA